MVSPTVITGVASAILTSWLADQLPRPGLPASEIERRLRNIVLSIITAFGVAYLTMAISEQWPQQGVTATTVGSPRAKRIVLPGYYGD